VRLVDTPGIGSVYRHNADVSYRFLPKADAVLFLLSADQPVSQAECELLKDVREFAGKIFFILDKADHLSEFELREAVTFAQITITEAMGHKPFIVPASARMALEGKLTDRAKRFSSPSTWLRATSARRGTITWGPSENRFRRTI
jgi:predicted GTPase